ncbi:high choriolytic enzyme 1-like [Scomber scombrus]|uniref:high choriolytic enzyme 1-like n=1 Tax=Scomber scombrus TaxID=13677 RepID=UPI002DD9226A|nr:high choriolytic enzyme 1-like [Scomber scombrus]
MTPVVLFVVLLSLTAVTPGATDEGDDGDSSTDVSEVIARANAGITTGLVHDDIVPNMKRNADPCTARGCKWRKYGRYVRVPIVISNSYSSAERNIIIKGLVTFHKSTCVRFYWRRWWHRSYLYIFSGTGCWSYLGRQGGGQRVSLRRNGCLYQSTVQHEVLHALGFHHEQVRSDRDRYVNILSQNIQSGKESNFRKVGTNNLGTPYDFNSVMHYSKYAFSKNGQPTIVAKSNPNLNFGQASAMSANDIARVNRLYGCRV